MSGSKFRSLPSEPSDKHEAQVQFALERGLPAMLGVLSTYKLPYPLKSFDMVHCSRCLVNWTAYDVLYLMEVDRVLDCLRLQRLKPKNQQKDSKDSRKEKDRLEEVSRRLCRENRYREMEPRITGFPDINNTHETSEGVLKKWPDRLNSAPLRVKNWEHGENYLCQLHS